MNQVKRHTLLFGFALGFLATLAQILLMREFWTIPGLGELSLGMVLCSWLTYIALGAWLGHRIPVTQRNINFTLGAGTLLVPAALLLVRFYELIFSAPQGEPLPTFQFAVLCIVAPLPGAVLSGLLFTAFASRTENDGGNTVQQMYMAEGMGAAVAGLGHAFVFSHLAGALPILLSALGLPGVTSAMGLKPQGGISRWLLPGLILIATATIVALGLDEWSLKTAFEYHPSRGQYLSCADTQYQRLCMGRHGEQYQLYHDGRLAYVFPDSFDRPLPVHLAMALHPRPKRVLIIGGGVSNRIDAAKMHHPEEIHYLDMDSKEIPFVEKWRDPHRHQLQKAKDIFFHSGYHRTFLSAHRSEFDVIIQFTHMPFTAADNASHTVTFFKAIKQALRDNGVFMVVSEGSANVASPPMAQLLASRYKTLNSVFSDVVPLIDIQTLFMASCLGPLTLSPTLLNRRLAAIDPALPYIVHPAETFSETRLKRSLATVREYDGEVNVDNHPRTFLHTLTLQKWIRESSLSALSNQDWQQMRHRMTGVAPSLLLGALILLATVVLLSRPQVPSELLSIGTTGLCGLGMEVVLIYWFSVIHGGLYHHIAWLLAGFMTGLSLGAYMGNRLQIPGHGRWIAELSVILTAMLVAGLTILQEAGPVTFAIAMCLAGGVTGFAFPVFLRSLRPH
ncbi:MAG: hypothetical protein JXX14_00795, partial [Deltaproteobacteria bacterium]|nr:hypothetical protein [Deltaproteobacteria bacterium]